MTFATATATSTTPTTPINWLGAGEIMYSTKNGARLHHTCGIDYVGDGVAHNLTNTKTTPLDECIKECSAINRCIGGKMESLSGRWAGEVS
ncbi:hypothetical protein NEUTE1DRAFT_150828, partial [Neurospora tetrasperma FGSC 2508]